MSITYIVPPLFILICLSSLSFWKRDLFATHMNINVAILSFTVITFITKLFLILIRLNLKYWYFNKIVFYFVLLLFPLVYIIITNFNIRSFLNIYTPSLSISFFISFLSFNLIALVRISFTILFRLNSTNMHIYINIIIAYFVLLFFPLVYIVVIISFLSFIVSFMISLKLLFHLD